MDFVKNKYIMSVGSARADKRGRPAVVSENKNKFQNLLC